MAEMTKEEIDALLRPKAETQEEINAYNAKYALKKKHIRNPLMEAFGIKPEARSDDDDFALSLNRSTPSGEWIVNVFGAVGGSHEISVVRKDNEHGRKSWGLGDEDRKIVISVSIHNDGFKDPHLWDALIGLAHSYASHLNAKDSGK